jgi:hypothetical protein
MKDKFGITMLVMLLKLASVTTVGTFASWWKLNTARGALSSLKIGTQTAALAFAGYSTTVFTASESYNGTSWTPVQFKFKYTKSLSWDVGTQTAALLWW